MYVPSHFSVDEATTRQFLATQDTADLVTTTTRGLVATSIPILYEPGDDSYGSVVGHIARNNEQWRLPALEEALMVLHGLEPLHLAVVVPLEGRPRSSGADVGLPDGARLRPVGGPRRSRLGGVSGAPAYRQARGG